MVKFLVAGWPHRSDVALAAGLWRPSQTAQRMRVPMAASRPRSSYDLGQYLGVHAIFIDAYVPNRVMVDHLPSPMLYTLVHVVAPSQESSR